MTLLLVPWTLWMFWLANVAPSSGIDYYQFWLVGQAQGRAQVSNIYSPEDRRLLSGFGQELLATGAQSPRLAAVVRLRQNIETFSTPFLYLAVNSITTGDYELDLRIFHVLGLAGAVVGIALLCRMLLYPWVTTCLILVAVLLCSEPLASDARVANINQLQLGVLAAYLWLQRGWPSTTRQALAGLLLGLLIMFKPTLGVTFAFLAMDWLAYRRWRTLVIQSTSAAAGGILAVVASSQFLGSPSAWLEWLAALPSLDRDANISVRIGNFSISRIVSELGGPDISSLLLVAIMLAVGSCVWYAAFRRSRSSAENQPASEIGIGQEFERDYLAVALGCAASVVALRLVWLHYYVLVLPLAIYLFRPHRTQWSGTAEPCRWPLELTLVCLASLALLGRPIRVLLPPVSPYEAALPFIMAAAVLLVLGLMRLYRLTPPVE